VPQQIDLFAKNAPTIGGMPVGANPLMTRLILDHADKRQMGSTRDGHDL